MSDLAATARGLRVALLNPCFFPEVRRGSERIVRDLASELIARGHRPRLITSHPGAPSRAVEDGLPVTRHWRPPEDRLTRRWIQEYLTHLPFSYASLRAGRDDLAHAFFATDALVAARWSQRTGRPCVFSYMGLPDRPVLADKRLKLPILSEALRGATAVVTLSETAAAAMWRWLGIEATVIHPGVDLATFAPGPARADEPTIFCPAASEDARKRVDLLAAAFAHVRRERADARLVVLRPRDPAAVTRLGLDAPGIELFDPVDDPRELAPVYRRAWVTALTSYREAFGVVLIESLACGTPVVGAASGAVPEVVGDADVGVLFTDDDVRAIARALLEALDRADSAGIAERCRARAADFSTARTGERHEQLYRALVAGR